jgi:alpha-mannosidase
MTEIPRTILMVCNAHLDPVWLWEWEEGAAAAISTFRTAADLCDEYEGFIFNHNEVILYRWIEEYEPELFSRIQRLVKEGKWHIMGGWYLQPDCNMPSGESFIRQILLGRRYFAEKFNARPTTAINFDPFGHTRGLVQILAKSGYDSYLFCRPDEGSCYLENHDFVWEGYDGSRVLGHRVVGWYNSSLGKAREKAEEFNIKGPQTQPAMMLWGVGNHGGGPSWKDVHDLAELIRESTEVTYQHSYPEAYFTALKTKQNDLPVHKKDINPWAVGCYTSMIRVKQKHRLLENELFATEKMISAAVTLGLMEYPQVELNQTATDLATCQFHDILPGSSIQPAEDMALRILDHGLETLSRIKARAFFALAAGQAAAIEGEIPILVYNPHPYPIRQVVECEFNLPDFNRSDSHSEIQVQQAGTKLPTQVEKEISNLNLDWRKRVAFEAELAPSQMNRFNCLITRVEGFSPVHVTPQNGHIHFDTNDIEVLINTQTGLIDRYRVHGIDFLEGNSCSPLVMLDNADPWGMLVRSYRNQVGTFNLVLPSEAARVSGVVNPALPSVRIIEDGAVRMIVEAVLGFEHSRMVIRYKLPKKGSQIEIEVRVHWNEKDRMLKLSFPTPFKNAVYMGQVAFGVDELPNNGDEVVAQQWTAFVDKTANRALTIINDGVYGSDCCYGEARISLLRSPAYSGHPIDHRPILPNDRYTPRIDQGERQYHFWINAGSVEERLEVIGKEAQVCNEKPMALSFFPMGGSQENMPFISIDNEAVLLTALKKAEADDEIIIRLYNSTNKEKIARVNLNPVNSVKEIILHSYEIRTFRFDTKAKTWTETNLIEEPLSDEYPA